MLIPQLRYLFLAIALGLLGGCGGGDDDTAAAPAAPAPNPGPTAPGVAVGIDKYVGSWTACIPEANSRSSRENLTVAKTGDASGSFTVAATEYSGTNCTGAPVRTENEAGSFTLIGTKTIGTETVDKVNIVVGNIQQKQVFVVRADGRFHTGIPTDEPGSAADAEGYPGAIEATGFSRP